MPKDPRCTGVSAADGKVVLGKMIKATSLLGGLLIGMISFGLGEINKLAFIKKMRLPVPSASGTTVFLVAMSALVSVFSQVYFLVGQGELSVFAKVLSLLVFTIPGVMLGAQFGVLLSNKINRNLIGKFVGTLFVILAVLTFLTVFQ